MTLKNILFLVFYCLSTFSFAVEIQRVDAAAYNGRVNVLNAACLSKGQPSFTGFCLSKEYGPIAPNNPTQVSISLGLEIASFEYYYNSCQHSDFPSEITTLTYARGVFDAALFYAEIESQKDALKNYVGRFYFCKEKGENDVTILNKLKWFKYMVTKYSNDRKGENNESSKFVTSKKSLDLIVECILSRYHGTGSDFDAQGIRAKDGSVVVVIWTPIQFPLAIVKSTDGGSITQYIGPGHKSYSSVPRPEVFYSAITGCQ